MPMRQSGQAAPDLNVVPDKMVHRHGRVAGETNRNAFVLHRMEGV